MFEVGLCLQSGQCACQVMPGRGWAVGKGIWQKAAVAQIRDAVMLLRDVVEVWQSWGQAGLDQGQIEARGKDRGQEPTQRVEPLCKIQALSAGCSLALGQETLLK